MLLAALLIVGTLQADQSDNFVMWGTLDSGGGRSSSAHFDLVGSLSQPEPVGKQSGYWYFDLYPGLLEPVPVSVELTSLPISIPPEGGTFNFNIMLSVNWPVAMTFDVWTDVIMPSGQQYGPLIGPRSLTLPSGARIDRDLNQYVPPAAPAGWYSYNAYVGVNPDIIIDGDSFPFQKLGADEGDGLSGWKSSGEGFEKWLATPGFEDKLTQSRVEIPAEFALEGNYPNPFNPTTAISYQLPAVSFVNLTVYDVTGRQVAELVNGWRDAGVHEVTFDGSGYASGVYIYRLSAAEFELSGKMVLMK